MKHKTMNQDGLHMLGSDGSSSNTSAFSALFKQWRRRLGYYSIFAAVPAINPTQTNIATAVLGSDTSSRGQDLLTDAFRLWRKRVGYYSTFVALPAIASYQAQASLVDRAVSPEAPRSRPTEMLRGRLLTSCAKPAFLKRQSEYRLPHQRGRFDIVQTLAGNDNCPGTQIAPGTYTAAAPYIDTGDTSGANDTVYHARPCFTGYYYYYYYGANSGPDHIYTFTITARGPNPEIRVTPGNGTYDPQIYILNAIGGTRCPATNRRIVNNCVTAAPSRSQGMSETIDAARIAQLPLNVPLHLIVDSGYDVSSGDPARQGPYTIRLQDLTISASVIPPRSAADFDGDGRTDVSVFRPGNGIWYVNRSQGRFQGMQWGAANDTIVPGDYDGDGKADAAVFRSSDQRWYILRSSDSVADVRPQFTIGAIPIPVIPAPGDFDGDGITDTVAFAPSFPGVGPAFIASGSLGTGGGLGFLHTGIPVISDYDGDGDSDFAVFRADGVWVIRRSDGYIGYQFGLPTDKLVPADYDGDGKTDVAVYRPSEGRWYIANTGSQTHSSFQFGAPGDIPAPGDYDGDGRADLAIFRPSDGHWWINRSSAGLVVIQWGQNGDRPAPAAFGN